MRDLSLFFRPFPPSGAENFGQVGQLPPLPKKFRRASEILPAAVEWLRPNRILLEAIGILGPNAAGAYLTNCPVSPDGIGDLEAAIRAMFVKPVAINPLNDFFGLSMVGKDGRQC